MSPTDLPPSPDPKQRPPASPSRSDEQDGGGDAQMWVIAKMVGTAFMFLGFLQIFLSISGGFELSGVVALLLYFGGLAIWANAAIEQPILRWGITIGALVLSAGFLHFGEILFWHKQVVFWATVVIVMYFMFNEPKKPD
jgi:hypothetical protein